MDPIPSRPAIAGPHRTLLSVLEQWVPLPDITPSYYHALAIALSILFLYTNASVYKIAIVGVILLVDWLDGATARRYDRYRRSGYIIDVVTDRVSEAFVFSAEAGMALGRIFFILWVINSALTFYSVYSNKHTSLPLRFAYLIILILQNV